MCILCKERFDQHDLLRLQCKNQSIIKFSGEGRSFYICQKCKDDKHIGIAISKTCRKNKKEKEKYLNQLKEILANG